MPTGLRRTLHWTPRTSSKKNSTADASSFRFAIRFLFLIATELFPIMTSKNSTSPSVGSTASGAHKRNSDDIGWEYGFCPDKNKMDTVKYGDDGDEDEVDPETVMEAIDEALGTNNNQVPRKSSTLRELFDEDFKSDNEEQMFEEDEYDSGGVKIVEEIED
ncbi:unnamed protein product [Lactuca virosa]|uniref:Uncharacterized protein n=1 Tax=Lactuca virosa TaxID=75947 RepID=A0AAU9MMA4_9ASTR|nr:unnamed protein product [Lactuca virosa]